MTAFLAEDFYCLGSAAPPHRWITCQSRTRQRSPFVKRFIEDELNLAPNLAISASKSPGRMPDG
jgi:hypothetical protein